MADAPAAQKVKDREAHESSSVLALTTIVELLLDRGYYPTVVRGLHPEHLRQLQQYTLEKVRPGFSAPTHFQDPLPVNPHVLLEYMRIRPSTHRPVVEAVLRGDIWDHAPGRVAGDHAGDVVHVMFSRNKLSALEQGQPAPPKHILAQVNPVPTVKSAPTKGKRKKKRASSRSKQNKIRPTFNTDMVRAFLQKYISTPVDQTGTLLRRAIFVNVLTRPNRHILPHLCHPSNPIACEVFTFQDLQYNPLTHRLVPRHQIMRPYAQELEMRLSSRRRGKPWSRFKEVRRGGGRSAAVAHTGNGASQLTSSGGHVPLHRGHVPAIVLHRGHVPAIVLEPRKTAVCDPIVLRLGLPAHTLLKVHLEGCLVPQEPAWTRVCYTKHDTVFQLHMKRHAPLLPEVVYDSDSEEETQLVR